MILTCVPCQTPAPFHGICVTNPDAMGTRQFFGNDTQRINACHHSRLIPGGLPWRGVPCQRGRALLLCAARTRLDPATGEDDFTPLESPTPEVCFPKVPVTWPESYYHSSRPLSGDFFRVSFSLDPLPGMSAKTKDDTETGEFLLANVYERVIWPFPKGGASANCGFSSCCPRAKPMRPTTPASA